MDRSNQISPGARLELEICDLNVDGSAVARLPGSLCPPISPISSVPPVPAGPVFFLERGLPGERVLAEVTGRRKKALLAKTLERLAPSPDEVEPFCPYFGVCGGCSFQNLAYPAQLRFKRERAAQTLSRIGRVDFLSGGRPEPPQILPSPRLTGYRNKMEYAFGPAEPAGPAEPGSGNSLALGLKRRNSNEVLNLEGCPLQSAAAGAILRAVRAWAARRGLAPWRPDCAGAGGLRSLVLREPEYRPDGGAAQRSAELICAGAAPPAPWLDELWEELQDCGLTSLLVTQASGGGRAGRPAKLYGPAMLREAFGPLLLDFPLSGFAQTNTGAAALLYAKAAEYAALRAGQIFWDVYCGAGALALYLGREAAAVLGLEQDEAAVRAARGNAARLSCRHCRFEAGEAARLLPAFAAQVGGGALPRPDLLLADPPRGGMSGRVLDGIVRAAPARLVYVSCDPATLARDLAALAPHYTLRDCCLVDMFPHTPHVEAVALLTPLRAGRERPGGAG